jgi:hypothetical protein
MPTRPDEARDLRGGSFLLVGRKMLQHCHGESEVERRVRKVEVDDVAAEELDSLDAPAVRFDGVW